MSAEQRPRNFTRPWILGVFYSISGLLFVLLLFAFPSLRALPLPTGAVFPTLYVIAVFPAAGLIWSIAGVIRFRRDRGLRWALGGMLCALVAITILGAIVWAERAATREKSMIEAAGQASDPERPVSRLGE